MPVASPDTAVRAISVQQFCTSIGIHYNTFFKLRKDGSAPKTFTVGRRRFIAVKAAEDWVRSRESA